MVTKQDRINKLTSYLFHRQEKNVAIPLITGKKQPVKGAAYKGGSWTWQDFKACSNNLMRKGDTFDIGILARSPRCRQQGDDGLSGGYISCAEDSANGNNSKRCSLLHASIPTMRPARAV